MYKKYFINLIFELIKNVGFFAFYFKCYNYYKK